MPSTPFAIDGQSVLAKLVRWGAIAEISENPMLLEFLSAFGATKTESTEQKIGAGWAVGNSDRTQNRHQIKPFTLVVGNGKLGVCNGQPYPEFGVRHKRSCSLEIIFISDDIIFAEISAGLYFD